MATGPQLKGGSLNMEFSDLKTVKFQDRMKSSARRIYSRIFPGCEIEDLRADGFRVHPLDQEFGIDSRLMLGDNSYFSIQEKYRAHKFLARRNLRIDTDLPDFTQEYKNGHGTQYEAPGEWFKLGAQLYFYGWANAAEDDFEKWVIIDVVRYKQLVMDEGGIENMGKLMKNRTHGRASFYCIPIQRLAPAWIYTHKTHPQQHITT